LFDSATSVLFCCSPVLESFVWLCYCSFLTAVFLGKLCLIAHAQLQVSPILLIHPAVTRNTHFMQLQLCSVAYYPSWLWSTIQLYACFVKLQLAHSPVLNKVEFCKALYDGVILSSSISKYMGLRMKIVEKLLNYLLLLYLKYKNKNESQTQKQTRTYEISRIPKTNQFEQIYIKHGRYTKTQYGIPTRRTKCMTKYMHDQIQMHIIIKKVHDHWS
jgi:hypothetical protein